MNTLSVTFFLLTVLYLSCFIMTWKKKLKNKKKQLKKMKKQFLKIGWYLEIDAKRNRVKKNYTSVLFNRSWIYRHICNPFITTPPLLNCSSPPPLQRNSLHKLFISFISTWLRKLNFLFLNPIVSIKKIHYQKKRYLSSCPKPKITN